jgi:hypothetical protein
VFRGLAQICDKPCISGSFVMLILVVKKNGRSIN